MRKSTVVAGALGVVGLGVLLAYSWLQTPEPETGTETAAAVSTATDAAVETPEAAPLAGTMLLELTVAGEANGTIVIDLLEEVAPLHADRIASLAESGAYDQVVFHRVIDGFMAQTGDVEFGKLGDDTSMAGRGGSDLADLPAEFSDLPFDRGMVGMARSQSPNSANSQFFIMFQDGHFLNGQYTIVGKVVEGMDIVDQIKLGTGSNGAVVGAPDYIASVKVTR